MSKLDTLLQNVHMAISPAAIQNNSIDMIRNPHPRLIVLVSGEEVNNVELTNQVWEIAKPQSLEVVLLALCNNFDEEAQVRRRLITMAAIIRDETVRADFQIGYGNNWLKLTRQQWRPGDILICTSDQYVGLWGRLLSQVLSSNFKTPVKVFSTSYLSRQPISKTMSNVIFWVGSLCIISIFFGVEALVPQAGQDWVHTFLLSLCVLFEIRLLWIWNSLFW